MDNNGLLFFSRKDRKGDTRKEGDHGYIWVYRFITQRPQRRYTQRGRSWIVRVFPLRSLRELSLRSLRETPLRPLCVPLRELSLRSLREPPLRSLREPLINHH